MQSRASTRFVGGLSPSSERRRILILVGEMGAGGLEQQLCYLLQGMNELRCQPALVVWNYRESDVNVSKVRALGVPMWGYPVTESSYRKLYEFAKLARTLRPDVVHSYSFYTNVAAFLAGRVAGATAIGSLRSELDLVVADLGPVLGRLNAMLPRALIANSHVGRKQIELRCRRLAPRYLAVVSNGLDLERFRTEPVPMRPPHSILGIGSLIPVKRWDRLLKLGQTLKQRGAPCVVQIAGDGPLRAHLASLAADLGIAEMTQFLGYRDDVPDLIAQARVVVHTSDSEGSPNAVMEALASGRPVVAVDTGDVARLVEDGETGFVVGRNDQELLVERVSALLSDDRMARQFGKTAACRARRDFSVQRLVHDTLEAYRAAGCSR